MIVLLEDHSNTIDTRHRYLVIRGAHFATLNPNRQEWTKSDEITAQIILEALKLVAKVQDLL